MIRTHAALLALCIGLVTLRCFAVRPGRFWFHSRDAEKEDILRIVAAMERLERICQRADTLTTNQSAMPEWSPAMADIVQDLTKHIQPLVARKLAEVFCPDGAFLAESTGTNEKTALVVLDSALEQEDLHSIGDAFGKLKNIALQSNETLLSAAMQGVVKDMMKKIQPLVARKFTEALCGAGGVAKRTDDQVKQVEQQAADDAAQSENANPAEQSSSNEPDESEEADRNEQVPIKDTNASKKVEQGEQSSSNEPDESEEADRNEQVSIKDTNASKKVEQGEQSSSNEPDESEEADCNDQASNKDTKVSKKANPAEHRSANEPDESKSREGCEAWTERKECKIVVGQTETSLWMGERDCSGDEAAKCKEDCMASCQAAFAEYGAGCCEGRMKGDLTLCVYFPGVSKASVGDWPNDSRLHSATICT